MRRFSCLFLSLVLGCFLVNATAQQPASSVPNLIHYGGMLKDAQAAPLASSTAGVTFAIYKQQDGGAPLWLETQNVTTDASGQYSVLLGSTTATGLPSDLFSQQEQRWLGVQVQGQPEQARVLLVSVPYAMKAAEADTLAGHSAAEFVTTDNLQNAVQQQLQQQPSGVAIALPAAKKPNGQPDAVIDPATNFIDTTSDQVVLVQQKGTGIGLSASSPGNVGVFGTVNSAPKVGVIAGVEGTSTVNNGYGMFGYSSAASGGVGIQGRSDSVNGIGLQGWAIGTGGIAINATSSATSGNPVGLVARISAPNATGALITNVYNGVATGPLINAQSNGAAKFTVSGSGNVTASGTFSGTQLISTVLPGTAPLQVASNTLVPMLNANLLEGLHASAFAIASGSPNYIQNGTTQQMANFSISGNGVVGGIVTAGSGVVAANNVPGTAAVVASNTSSTSINGSAGVFAFNFNDANGAGAYGENDATSGGFGVFGHDKNISGESAGVLGVTKNPTGAGGAFQNKSTQAGALLLVGLDADSTHRFAVDNQGNVMVTTGTTNQVTAPLMPVNHARNSVTVIDINFVTDVSLDWAFPFPDTNYTVTCSPQLNASDEVDAFSITSQDMTTVSVRVSGTANPGDLLTIHCLAVHD